MSLFLLTGLIGLGILGVSFLVGELVDGALDVLPGEVFTTASLGGFISALGFTGLLVQDLGVPDPLALAAGAGAGIAAGWFAWVLTKWLRHESDNTDPGSDKTIGAEGRIVTAIPTQGYGTVKVIMGGKEVRLNAKLDENHPLEIEAGTEVYITSSLSPTAVTVAPKWRELS